MSASTAVVIGAGNRGRWVYARWAHAHPGPHSRRRGRGTERRHARRRGRRARASPPRTSFATGARASRDRVSPTSRSSRPATRMHVEPALAAFERGYDVLLEKPIAPTPAECVRVVEAAEASGPSAPDRPRAPLHAVLREGPRDRAQRADRRAGAPRPEGARRAVAHDPLLRAREVPQPRDRRADPAGEVLPRSRSAGVAGGSAGAARRVVRRAHPLSPRTRAGGRAAALQRRLSGAGRAARTTPSRSTPDPTTRSRAPGRGPTCRPTRAAKRGLRALETGRYGRCVFHCDNDALDHQVVALEFEGGVTASFGLHGLAANEQRTIRVTGTRGEVRGVLDGGEIEVSRAGTLGVERFEIAGLGVRPLRRRSRLDGALQRAVAERQPGGARVGSRGAREPSGRLRGRAGARNGPGRRHAALPRRSPTPKRACRSR